MKYLIACLGNIGVEYENTRHNIGFKVADGLLSDTDSAFCSSRLGSIAEVKHRGKTLIVLKPSTYMNLSGKAVNYWLQAEKIGIENLLVVVDDIALQFGAMRLRGIGSDGGHNGLKNITEILGTSQYARLRLGVGSNFAKGQQIDYVLGQWTDEESAALPPFLAQACDAVKSYAAIGVERTMNAFNTR